MSYGDEYGEASERGIPSQTRTHLPDEPGADSRRGAASPRRSLVTVVGVVLVLIGAIVFANRADDSAGSAADDPAGAAGAAAPTAPTGEDPVETTTGGVPSGFPQTEQGAESAAANFAVALGGEDMFRTESRHAVLDTVMARDEVADTRDRLDTAYSADFLDRLGLDEDGAAPAGLTFVSRTVPIGTELVTYDGNVAEVEVWSASLLGLAGEGSENPVTSSWFTVTFELVWEDGDWRAAAHSQVEGPAPVPGDLRASTSDEIAEAVEQFGGFTYAR